MERIVNDLILKNIPIRAYQADREQLKTLPLRKIPPRRETIRLVEIEGWDHSPCSGTHTAGTAEIGSLKILRAEKYKGKTRVYFLCGGRAWRDYHQKHLLTTTLVALLSVPLPELAAKVTQELQQKLGLEETVGALRQELLAYRAQKIVDEASGSPLKVDLPEGSLGEAQLLAQKILQLGTFSIVLTVGERLVLAHNLAGFQHCGNLVKEQALPLGGRGGGGPFRAQVFFEDREQLKKFQLYLEKHFQIPRPRQEH